MKIRITIVVMMISLLTACGRQESSMENSPLPKKQKIEETQIEYDEWSATYFMDEMKVGWNLGDSLGSSAQECGYDLNLDLETKWGNPKVTRELIDYVASLGFNTIRIPVSWCYNCGRDENGHLEVGTEWMKRVHEVVDYAAANDMYIIVNTMCDSWELFYCGVESQEEWAQIEQDARDLWTQIAESFVDYDNHLIFESYNEVDNAIQGFTYSDLAAEQMNTLNQIFVESVRQTGGNNCKRVLMIPTLFDSKRTNITDAFIMPKDSTNNSLIVTVHCYEGEFDQDIEWIFQSLEDFSNRIGAPIMIGEFGARDDYSLIEWREEFTSNYVARALAHGIKCCIWDDGYHWKLIDRYDYDNSEIEVIESLFEGLSGTAYETEPSQKIVLNSMEDFFFGGLDLSTGNISLVDYETYYWASLTTKSKEDDLRMIESGNTIVISMVTKNEAANFWIYGITFYDKEKEPISFEVGKNIAHKFMCVNIPVEAVYYAVNTYDPYNNYKMEQVEEFLTQGDLCLTISFIEYDNKSQLYPVQIGKD